jgi:Methyltransferase domain
MRADPPFFHADHDYLGLAWPALDWLEQHVQPSMATLETGAGASTVIFAANQAIHTAVSPVADEHERIRSYCHQHDIPTDSLRFVAQSSHLALPDLPPEPLDVALIDGAHSFPFPILDWVNIAPRLRVGGHLLVDDACQPAVNILVRYLRASEGWKLEGVLGHRTPCFRKTSDQALTFDWDDRVLGRARFDYLPPARRLVAAVRYWGVDRTPLRTVASRAARLLNRRT